ncbi:GrdX protein [Anaerosalibacter bizertensis]|uniref:GrdX family protein n=1 Tax=Anaerosalibacter bizertensis TaxID=932217 RepID=A0A844FDY5_9FIRM|nr:GrdX family protein [Anaerosalibacter bizertensis]MBV1818093.1 GrdX family protein [Bacteroidales bacterium MSK.15.36]MBU5294518.1 GrdX family protein [Anaerosalibacter bizertensis]MCB5559875.1 GrdX family protein [Anaerosalibacter bizertensis]MCG4565404.1 GrdX family protein [Anaerosalibacter bizertensis]MCG4582382.1 GrdX family protein [Anaerosalibacter bizertensis]
MTESIIVTNNPLVKNRLKEKVFLEYYDVDYLKLLEIVRDKVHLGYKLLTHPLSGSVKPNETPYKTVIVSENSNLDTESLMIIENSIATTKKMLDINNTPPWNKEILEDFQVIDLSLIEGVLYRL